MRVFVLDVNKRALDPCHSARARQLLRSGRAAVFRRYPFTIILKDRTAEESVMHSHRIKIDPGSRVTGLALVQEETGCVVWAAELQHRGEQIKRQLLKRRALRRARRNYKTRYRKPRFDNRCRSDEWLPPSLESRVRNIMTWVERLRRYAPVSAISVELAHFDTQRLQNSEISGVKYQQGELFGYEMREYLLEKWGRCCAYCEVENVPLEVEVGTSGRTKYNRTRLGLSKVHWTDAACVGKSTPDRLHIETGPVSVIRATGHGKRQRCGTNRYGFPIRHAPRAKRFMGFQTGDVVRAIVPRGKHAGVHEGRIAIRFRPSFRLNGFDVHPKYLQLLQRADGYAYALETESLGTRERECDASSLRL
ncbi:MAG: RNA-guided endonuclease IscB [Candidatus Bipolaricaulia bacterium]